MNCAPISAPDSPAGHLLIPLGMAAVLRTGAPTIVVRCLRGQFVEFEFTLGDPLLALEMVMPTKVFQEFCLREDATVRASDEIIEGLRTSGVIDQNFSISPMAYSRDSN